MKITYDPSTNTATIESKCSGINSGIRESKFPRIFSECIIQDLGFSSTVRVAIAKDVSDVIKSAESFEDGLKEMKECGMLL